MKKNILIKGMLGLCAAVMITGCSDNYLDLAPESDPSTSAIQGNANNALLAVRGIARMMNTQYQEISTGNQYIGESYINTIYNDGMGQDCYNLLAFQQFGSAMSNWDEMGNERASWFTYLAWNYSYTLIRQANIILDGIEEMQGDEALINLIKAEALTYRAHGYTKLLQFYAPRWEDSENGNKYCVVLRTTATLDEMPLATMNEVKTQIYADLDEALKCYDATTMEREYKWEPSREIACGIYSRAALIFHDWAKAQEMAKAAQNGFAVMDNKTAFGGFYETNNDFMWESSSEDSDIYYWSWGAHYTCNGQYTNSWGLCDAISLDLYDQLDKNDVRRNWFFTPDKIVGKTGLANRGKLTKEAFWDASLVSPTDCDMSIGPTMDPKNGNRWGLQNAVAYYGLEYIDNQFTGDMNKMIADTRFACYMQYGSSVAGGFMVQKGVQANLGKCTIGAQYKFWSIAPYGTSTYPYMRCSEMVLNEAEAAYENGDYATAKACLEKINKLRISGYKCNSSGEALRDEIRLCKRIELWGEGYSWSDLKRWNLPMKRRPWIEGNANSGNIGANYAIERKANEQAGWRYAVPAIERDFNSAIDVSLLPDPKEYTPAVLLKE